MDNRDENKVLQTLTDSPESFFTLTKKKPNLVEASDETVVVN